MNELAPFPWALRAAVFDEAATLALGLAAPKCNRNANVGVVSMGPEGLVAPKCKSKRHLNAGGAHVQPWNNLIVLTALNGDEQ